MRTRRPRTGRRRIGLIVMGLVLIGAGLFVFRYASDISVQVSGFVSPPPPGGSNPAGSGFSEGYLPFVVWGFGFSLIGAGGAMLRRAVMSPMGGASVGGMMGGTGMRSPERSTPTCSRPWPRLGPWRVPRPRRIPRKRSSASSVGTAAPWKPRTPRSAGSAGSLCSFYRGNSVPICSFRALS
jgi:hypothetical protein